MSQGASRSREGEGTVGQKAEGACPRSHPDSSSQSQLDGTQHVRATCTEPAVSRAVSPSTLPHDRGETVPCPMSTPVSRAVTTDVSLTFVIPTPVFRLLLKTHDL